DRGESDCCPCPKGTKECFGKCRKPGQCCLDSECPAGQHCGGDGTCRCRNENPGCGASCCAEGQICDSKSRTCMRLEDCGRASVCSFFCCQRNESCQTSDGVAPHC